MSQEEPAGSTLPRQRLASSEWEVPRPHLERFGEMLSALEQLTRRELEVFSLLGLGLRNREIARDLSITERTVKAHVGNALDELGLTARCEAAVVAFLRGTTVARRPDDD